MSCYYHDKRGRLYFFPMKGFQNYVFSRVILRGTKGIDGRGSGSQSTFGLFNSVWGTAQQPKLQ